MTNTIWEIKDKRGSLVSLFEDMVEDGKDYFCNLFKAPSSFPLNEIIKLTPLFPTSITEEMNDSLQKGILKK